MYVETGLHRGRRLLVCAPRFEEVHGIELDAHWYAHCRDLTAGLDHVRVHHGDTRELLPRVLDRYPDTSCFIHLDAHFCRTDPPIRPSEFPLWDELTLIRERRVRDIVSVDDVHTFGRARHDLRYREDAVEWEGVTKTALLDFFGDRVYDSKTVADAFVIWKLPDGDEAARPSRRRWPWPWPWRGARRPNAEPP